MSYHIQVISVENNGIIYTKIAQDKRIQVILYQNRIKTIIQEFQVTQGDNFEQINAVYIATEIFSPLTKFASA